MTDEKEIASLIDRMRREGAVVSVRLDFEGRTDGVAITGARGIGPHEMGPIAAAERMRAWLALREADRHRPLHLAQTFHRITP